MKKLGKILVVVLTLALLLGAIVITASAENDPISYTVEGSAAVTKNGNGDPLTLPEAINMANADESNKTITIKLHEDYNLQNAMYVTRTSGKIVVDLNGHMLTLSNADTMEQSLGYDYKHANTKYYEVALAIVGVKATADTNVISYYYVDGLELHDAYLEGADPSTAATLTSFTPGATYIGTVYNGINRATTRPYIGAFTLSAAADLEVLGGHLNDSAGNKGMAFFTPVGVDANIYVHDVRVTTSNGVSWESFAHINGGKLTVERANITATNSGGVFRIGNNAELDVKASYIYYKYASGANEAIFRFFSNNTEMAEDGYHVEIDGCLIISEGCVFSGYGADSSNVRKKSGSPMSGIVNGESVTSSAGTLTSKVHYFTSYDTKIEGTNYYQSYVLVENCNIEQVAYVTNPGEVTKRAMITHGAFSIDFESSNLLAAQYFLYIGYTTRDTQTYNFYNSYVELTGRGNFVSGDKNAALLHTDREKTAINLYNTEYVVSDLLKNAEGYTVKNLPASVKIYNAFNSDMTSLVTDAFGIYENGNRHPISALSGGKIDANGLLTGKASGGRNDTNRLSANIGMVGVTLSAVQGNITIETENGNDYFCYDPSYVYYGGVTYNVGDAKGEEVTLGALDETFAGYALANADGVLTWTVNGKEYNYTHHTSVANSEKAVAGWDIDSDGIMEYIDVNGDNKPDYVNLDLTGKATACSTKIPEKYSEIYDSLTPYIGQQANIQLKGLSYIYYSFDYMNAPGSSEFLGFSFGASLRNSGNLAALSVQIHNNGNFSVVKPLDAADSGKVIEGALKLNQWNKVSVIFKLVPLESGYSVIGYWFVNGEFCFATKEGSADGATLIQNGLRGSARGAFGAGAKMCIDNVVTGVYAEGYENRALDALISGKETKLNTWLGESSPSDKATVSWTNPATAFTKNSTYISETIYPTTISTSTAKALNNGAYATVTLGADVSGFEVKAPMTVIPADNDFFYYSKNYKSTENGGAISFEKASDADMVTVTIDYLGEVVTETYASGSYFWFDADKIPDVFEGFYAETAQDIALYYDGAKVNDAIYAALLAPQKLTENAAHKLEKLVDKQYGWIIFDNSDEVRFYGVTWAELKAKVDFIEAHVNPAKNDADVKDYTATDGVNSSLYNDDLTTRNYTIKLYTDFTDATTLDFYNHKTREITIDLNGKSVISVGSIARANAYHIKWEITEDGKFVSAIGWDYENSKVAHTTAKGAANNDPEKYNVVNITTNASMYVSLISSARGASLVILPDKDYVDNNASTYADVTPLATSYTSYVYYKALDKGAVVDKYDSLVGDARSYLGTTSASPMGNLSIIGPDENVINVKAPALTYAAGFKSYCYIYNVNAEVSARFPINSSAGQHYITNSTIYSTSRYSDGFLYCGDGHKETEILRSNIITKNAQNLFYAAGFDAATTNEVWIDDSRIINFYLTATNYKYDKQAAGYEPATRIMSGCYYTLPYDAEKCNTIYLADERTTGFKQYAANVLWGETVKINGVDYVLTYKVVTDDELVNVTFNDKDGAKLADAVYAKGAIASYNATVANDIISNKQYSYAGAEALIADATLTVSEKIVPAFALTHNLSLDSNLYHNIKLPRFVNNKSVLDFIIEIKIGDTVVYGEGVNLLGVNNGGDEAAGTTDDLLYTIIEVKSNQIADSYDIMIKFKDESEAEHASSVSTSILAYLEYGLANYEENVERDLYVSLIHYGYASYNYFKNSTEAGKAALAELAAAYPQTVAIPEGDKNASGDFFDVEFVLDGALVYRFYFEEFENFDSCEYTAYYTKLGADKVTALDLAVHFDGERYYVDVALNAYEFAQDVTVKVTLISGDGVNEIAEATYTVADYYAEIADGNNAALKALIKAVYGYATKANAYKLSVAK